MAQMPQFIAQPQTIRPSETGIEALQRSGRVIETNFAIAGRAIGGAISEVGGQIGDQIDQANTRNEISKGGASYAQLTNTSVQAYTQAAKASDPNDQEFGRKYINDTVEPALQQWQGQFTTKRGQEWALGQAERFRDHMTTVVQADAASRTLAAVHGNFTNMVNQLTQQVGFDPSSLNHAYESVDSTIDAMLAHSPNMSAADAAKVKAEWTLAAKKQIGESAALGMINANPGQALHDIQSGALGPYVNGQEVMRAAKSAQQQQRIEARLAHTEAIQQAQETSQKVQSDLLRTLTPGPDGRLVVPPDFMAKVQQGLGHGLRAQEYENLIHFGQGQTFKPEAPVVTNPAAYQELANRVLAGNGQQGENLMGDIMKAHVAHQLSPADFSTLTRAAEQLAPEFNKDPVVKQAMTQLESNAKQVLKAEGGFNFMPDPANVAAYSRWYSDFLPKLVGLPNAEARRGLIMSTMQNLQAEMQRYQPNARSAVDDLVQQQRNLHAPVPAPRAPVDNGGKPATSPGTRPPLAGILGPIGQ